MKSFKLFSRVELIFERRTEARAFVVVWPTLIVFPPGTDANVPGRAWDATLSWLYHGVTLRIACK